MSYLALQKDTITDDETKFQNGEAKIFFSPLPSLRDNEYPIVWLDLHISGDGYEVCGKDSKLKFEKYNGDLCTSIRPGLSLRLITQEKIGVQRDVTGIVVNLARIAVKGLFIAPGKIDPGFSPNQLTLVITNHSKRSIDLKAGEKIAAIAFAQTSMKCAGTKSSGWANRRIEGYSKSSWDRFKEPLKNIDIFDLVKNLITAAVGAVIVLIVQYFLKRAGFE
ncbi:MAG: hypothetical protein K6U04_07085 [Armatimonadetes bacterium]|nr:hypothetical protein [Armatimonadota bacterium]